MCVPKMAKNGFNSVPSVGVISRGLDTEWESGTGTKTKRGIRTILDQFRNSHARYGKIQRYLKDPEKSAHCFAHTLV